MLDVAAPARGYVVTALGDYLAEHAPARVMEVREGSSWSCAHGIARWSTGCACTEGDSSWKSPFRRALRTLAARVDAIYAAETAGLLRDPWSALEEYFDLCAGVMAPAEYWARHAARPLRATHEARLKGLLAMQVARQAMFVSCAWFFEDIDRLEPRISLSYAHRAVSLAHQHAGANLRPAFADDLVTSRSWRTGRTAADIYATFAQSVRAVA